MSNIIHQDQIAAGPEHISQELGQFSHITEQKQLSEAPHLLQGHFVKYDTSGGWHLPVILIFWMLTQWLEGTSVAATPLWSHSGSPEAKMKVCFSAYLLPAPPENLPVRCLGVWAAVTAWHLMPFSLWNTSLIPSYLLTDSSLLLAPCIPLGISLCIWPFFHPLYKYLSTRMKGKWNNLLLHK